MKDRLRDHYGANFRAVARQKSEFPEWAIRANSKVEEEPQHRKLGIIDRVTRNIRDIAFANHWETISPAEMQWIVKAYNQAPHRTLSDLMDFDVSPDIAQNDKALQDALTEAI
jgi:hypothetical protein